ncbi:c-type cytochrome [Sulfurospirillum sp. 1307]|jgi:cytochrome c553
MKKLVLVLAFAAASTLMAADGAALYKKCAACHGAKAEKKALNKSHVIQGWDAAKIEAALKGYKAGTYGGAMKGLMKGQVASYDDAKIKAVAEYISKLK